MLHLSHLSHVASGNSIRASILFEIIRIVGNLATCKNLDDDSAPDIDLPVQVVSGLVQLFGQDE
jgi:hypothetical protein